MNTLFPFIDFMWILQKEEYESARYTHWLGRFFFRRNFVHSEKLIYTSRARITLGISVLIWVLSFAYVVIVMPWQVSLILGIVWIVAIPLFILLANVLLWPFFIYVHVRVQKKAARKLRENPSLKIVAIAGSYGKTTTKHFLYDLLRFNYRTQMIPETINTTAGIAAWVLKELNPSTEILIVEMDAYHQGEIAASCAITPPNVSIITNIGEQHLQRFKSQVALQRAIGEVASRAKPKALIVADQSTLDMLGDALTDCVPAPVDVNNVRYEGKELSVDQLSVSNRENLSRALRVAEEFHIPQSFIEDAVMHLELPERRQKPTEVFGYEGIDDSFNISLSTARAGLSAARSFADTKKKKLLVVVAGIPELGPDEQEGNRLLGESVREVADHVVLLQSMFAGEIRDGLGDAPRTEYARFEDFLSDRERFPANEWILLLQPTLPDLYY